MITRLMRKKHGKLAIDYITVLILPIMRWQFICRWTEVKAKIFAMMASKELNT